MYKSVIIVGLGRIGRHALRFVLDNYSDVELYLNDLNNDPQNLAYLLNYEVMFMGFGVNAFK